MSSRIQYPGCHQGASNGRDPVNFIIFKIIHQTETFVTVEVALYVLEHGIIRLLSWENLFYLGKRQTI